MTMALKLLCLAALLCAVSFAAPSSSAIEETHVMSPKVTELKKQFNELQVQLKSGEKVTPEVASTVKKLIDMVTNDIEPTIKEAHDADQDEINELMDRIDKHNIFTEEWTAELLKQAADLRQKMHEHNDHAEQWRLQGIAYKASIPVYEATYYNRSTVCCRRNQVAVVALEYTPASYSCDFTASDASGCSGRADSSIQKYTEEPFRAGQARYDHWHNGCNNEKAQEIADFKSMDDHDKACDKLQAETIARKEYITTTHTRFMKDWHRVTTSYVPIYKKLRQNYTRNEVVMWEREETRRLEWNATQLIKCLLEGYEAGGSFNEAGMKECEGQISDYHLYLAYPDWVCMLDYNPVLPEWPKVTDTSPWKDDCQETAAPDDTPYQTCVIPADEVASECTNHINQDDAYGEMTPAQALALHMSTSKNDEQIGKAIAEQKADHNNGNVIIS